MFEIIFSPSGRIKRLPYFLLSSLSGMIFLAISSVMLIRTTGTELESWLSVVSGGIMEIIKVAPIAGLFYAIGAWVQICLSFKRSRDFSGKTTFAKIYMTLTLTPMVVLGLFDTPIQGIVLAIVFGIPQAIMATMLLLKKSKEGEVSAETVKVFGARAETDSEIYEPNSLGEITDETDLVARAAELRMAAEARMAKQVTATSSLANKPYNSGFGKRTSTPAFGNR